MRKLATREEGGSAEAMQSRSFWKTSWSVLDVASGVWVGDVWDDTGAQCRLTLRI